MSASRCASSSYRLDQHLTSSWNTAVISQCSAKLSDLCILIRNVVTRVECRTAKPGRSSTDQQGLLDQRPTCGSIVQPTHRHWLQQQTP